MVPSAGKIFHPKFVLLKQRGVERQQIAARLDQLAL
jgi:hypothetical protein